MATEKIYIGIDNERIEATGKILEDIIADRAEIKAKKEAEEQEEAAKAIAKAALLERLGITAEEATLLLS